MNESNQSGEKIGTLKGVGNYRTDAVGVEGGGFEFFMEDGARINYTCCVKFLIKFFSKKFLNRSKLTKVITIMMLS